LRHGSDKLFKIDICHKLCYTSFMSFGLLRSFVEVYRQRSLSAAAEALSLTQPAVSGHVAALETMLGRRLFERTRRGVLPLPAADELYAALGNSIDQAESVLALFRARSSGLSGAVRITGPAEYIGEQFAAALTRLAEAGVELRLSTGNRDTIYAQLASGDVDLAVTASLPDTKTLGAAQLAEERFILVAPKAMAPATDAGELIAGEPYCAYDSERPLIRQWCASNAIELPTAQPRVIMPDLRGLLRFVIAGAGWAVLPDYLCRDALRDGLIHEPFANLEKPKNRLFLAWAKGHLRHPRVAFAQQLLLK
jgi:DNA-binding transcriptional LysR family regulator